MRQIDQLEERALARPRRPSKEMEGPRRQSEVNVLQNLGERVRSACPRPRTSPQKAPALSAPRRRGRAGSLRASARAADGSLGEAACLDMGAGIDGLRTGRRGGADAAMILTCPDCATRYFVDEAKLGPAGRKVRCASCGAAWRAELESETLDLTPVASPLDAPPQPEGVVSAAEALPKSFRAQQEARRRTRQAVAAGVVWASLGGRIRHPCPGGGGLPGAGGADMATNGWSLRRS